MSSQSLDKIIIGDALNLIKNVKERSVDLIFCDFPFKFDFKKIESLEKDFWRVLKETGSLVMINNPTNFFKIIPYFQRWIFRNELVLIRPYKFIPFGRKQFYFKHNLVIWLTKGKDYYFKDMGFTDVLDNIHYRVKGKHVGSLPEKLVEMLILTLTKEGDLVLDVFAGYGTVLKVCKKLRRKYLGFEINKENLKYLA